MDKKFAPYIFASIMALAMSLCMSFIFTLVNVGMDEGFLDRWGKDFLIGTAVAFPISMLVAPLAQKLVERIVKE